MWQSEEYCGPRMMWFESECNDKCREGYFEVIIRSMCPKQMERINNSRLTKEIYRTNMKGKIRRRWPYRTFLKKAGCVVRRIGGHI